MIGLLHPRWCSILRFAIFLCAASAFAQTSLDLRAGWKFAPDARNVGARQRWMAEDFDDTKWATVDATKPWEDQGYPDFNGIGWYRKRVQIPADWSEVWVGFGGVDDAYELYVNGRRVARYGLARNANLWRTQTVTDITTFVEKGKPATLTLRVFDWGGVGGLVCAPVALAGSREFFNTPEEKLRALARANPGWLLPAWARGQLPSWTAIGMAGGHSHALIANDATYQPRARAFSVTHWLWMDQTLFAPSPQNIAWQLADGFSPLPIAVWQVGERGEGVRVTQQWFVWGKDVQDEKAMLFSLVSLENLSEARKEISLLTALRPYTIPPPEAALRISGFSPIQQVFRSDRWTLINGKLALFCEQPPSAFGAASAEVGDLFAIAIRGQMPAAQRTVDANGMASAMLRHDLALEPRGIAQIRFRLPMAETEPTAAALALNDEFDTARSYEQARGFWSATLDRVKISIPEKNWADGYRASLGALLLALDGQTFRAGPFGGEVSAQAADEMLVAIEGGGLAEAAALVRKARGKGVNFVWTSSWDAVSAEQDWLRFVRPNSGAFLHRGRVWPAHGLNFAHALLRLGQRDASVQIIRWHWAHQTFPYLYTWSEQIGRGERARFAAGEQPSALAAAAYANLFRSIFVYEHNEQLILAAGVPREWMKAESAIEIGNFPTLFGPLGYRLSYDPSTRVLRLLLTGNANPPRGFVLHSPVDLPIQNADIDGQSALRESFKDSRIMIPPTARAVTVRF